MLRLMRLVAGILILAFAASGVAHAAAGAAMPMEPAMAAGQADGVGMAKCNGCAPSDDAAKALCDIACAPQAAIAAAAQAVCRPGKTGGRMAIGALWRVSLGRSPDPRPPRTAFPI